MSDLIHIAYVSFSNKELNEKELEELLIDIRKRNQKQKVTGLLLYNDGSFIQVIEGPSKMLIELYEKIKKDHRHENIVKLLEEPIKKRAFPDWSMGFRRLSKKQMSGALGFSDFMTADNPEKLIKNSTKEIIHLLNSFRRYT